VPCGFEIDAGLVEGFSGAVALLVGLGSRIEAAGPAPLVDGDARLCRDGADMDIAVIDAPAVLAFGITAAGEGRHGPLKRRLNRESNRVTGCAWNTSEVLPIAGVEKLLIPEPALVLRTVGHKE
jgi:hypothetical protein